MTDVRAAPEGRQPPSEPGRSGLADVTSATLISILIGVAVAALLVVRQLRAGRAGSLISGPA